MESCVIWRLLPGKCGALIGGKGKGMTFAHLLPAFMFVVLAVMLARRNVAKDLLYCLQVVLRAPPGGACSRGDSIRPIHCPTQEADVNAGWLAELCRSCVGLPDRFGLQLYELGFIQC